MSATLFQGRTQNVFKEGQTGMMEYAGLEMTDQIRNTTESDKKPPGV